MISTINSSPDPPLRTQRDLGPKKPLISRDFHLVDLRTKIAHAKNEFRNASSYSSALEDLQTHQAQVPLSTWIPPLLIAEKPSMSQGSPWDHRTSQDWAITPLTSHSPLSTERPLKLLGYLLVIQIHRCLPILHFSLMKALIGSVNLATIHRTARFLSLHRHPHLAWAL